jgi:hypothetical protein
LGYGWSAQPTNHTPNPILSSYFVKAVDVRRTFSLLVDFVDCISADFVHFFLLKDKVRRTFARRLMQPLYAIQAVVTMAI